MSGERARPRHTLRLSAAALLAVTGGLLGLSALGNSSGTVGPLQVHYSLQVAWGGDTVLDIPPLGSLRLDTHDGIIAAKARVERVRPEVAAEIAERPDTLTALGERVEEDLRTGAREVVLRGVAGLLLGGSLLPYLVLHRRRDLVTGGGVSLMLILSSAGGAWASWDERALDTPRYEGLLASAPAVIGNARDVAARFDTYNKQLAGVVGNVAELYGNTAGLPVAPETDQVRFLHVSDIHSNPGAYEQIREIVEQFKIDAVLDTGDSTDRGAAFENGLLQPIETIGVPWIWVKGNHDSAATVEGMQSLSNVMVLQNETITVEGIKISGVGDPRYTSDIAARPGAETEKRLLTRAGRELRRHLVTLPRQEDGMRTDIALVHDPAAAAKLDGAARLILSGHAHQRSRSRLEGGSRLHVEGSTGAAGLRGLEGEGESEVMSSVLHIDQESREIVAWDDITIDGFGAGAVTVRRSVAGSRNDTESGSREPLPEPEESPSGEGIGEGPTGAPSEAPLPAAVPTTAVPTTAVPPAAVPTGEGGGETMPDPGPQQAPSPE